MRRGARAPAEFDPKYGQRFWSAVALVAQGALWLTADLAPWTRALCWAAIAVGAVAAARFGWRHLDARRARR
ncbi:MULTISPECIES: hypothetical protein [unclassified Saccharopolyspora]|uniref:hypothetical protein n=1 Tax=unclassified Saccharopolyspora TaxID=2646250 RepID=UPI001CD2518B|nr:MULTISPECIES: hypothetical protein [unclassified Saccharopolyspora]MCA1188092.1 hypothetical protein [Saccharopolyspora sp. 6T]MCA1193975.1 hypothetical protein [Saccharopolyspora sp. 6V]MCA1228671.1 hypothetical protein [Saccharopolyspora sp. 6M]MCA1279296.1 hypothetical protein [Saccharopolyspora sp. 7B]